MLYGIQSRVRLNRPLHVVEVVNKANKVLGLIKRIIGSVNKEIFSTLYKTLVRPILEYASPAWCPYLIKNIVFVFVTFLISLQNVPSPIITRNYKLNRRTVIVINIHSLLKLFVNGKTCLPMLLR